MAEIIPRDTIATLALFPGAAACGTSAGNEGKNISVNEQGGTARGMQKRGAIREIAALGFPWLTRDPFIACMHHDDNYPKGDDRMAPTMSLAGRDLGHDFSRKDGFSMYHGRVVPGFPRHPHRGFETVTVVRRGLVDHSDSLGAAARYGDGDVQWLTAGKGILHAEMFPLLRTDRDNPLELFQIWLNLPAKRKLADPYFSMFWNANIPRVARKDAHGREARVTIIAGALEAVRPLAPPPSSWASEPAAEVAIWTIALEPHAEWTLPGAAPGLNRMLYYFRGQGLRAGGREIASYHALDLYSERPLSLVAGPDGAELLLLQGRPIAEPVVQYGPFVMNTRAEIQQAFMDYQRTQFGGWPWPKDDPVHARSEGRFVRFIDGQLERPV